MQHRPQPTVLFSAVLFITKKPLSPVQSKCPIDAVDGSGKTALHHAGKLSSSNAFQASQSQLNRILLFLTPCCFNSSCFISPPAASGSIQIVQLLCELKSPINLKDAVCTFILTPIPQTYFSWLDFFLFFGGGGASETEKRTTEMLR